MNNQVTNTEKFVPVEMAEKLKELKYTQYPLINAPKLTDVIDWLREKHFIHICIITEQTREGFNYAARVVPHIYKFKDIDVTKMTTKDFIPDYYETLRQGIEIALELIGSHKS